MMKLLAPLALAKARAALAARATSYGSDYSAEVDFAEFDSDEVDFVQFDDGMSRDRASRLRGIRIRFGRSLVTVSGVVLGIAFLMSNLTGQLIKQSIAKESAERNTVNLMQSLVQSEIGDVAGRHLAIAVFGQLSAAESHLIRQLVAGNPAEVRGLGFTAPGVKPARLADLSHEAALLLVLGNQPDCPATLTALTAGMSQTVVLDSLAARTFADSTSAAV